MKITAEDSKEFKKIEDAIATLPKQVSEQIISAKMGMDIIDCKLEMSSIVYAPKGVSSFTDTGGGYMFWIDNFNFTVDKSEEPKLVKIQILQD